MALLDELRATADEKRFIRDTPLSPGAAERIVQESLPKWREIWLRELRVSAESGERFVGLSYGMLGKEGTTHRRRALEAFLRSYALTYEEGRAHYVSNSHGEWQVEGLLLVSW